MSSELPDHYEPRPHERRWYNHVQTGDRGYFVKRDGVEMVRYDNPNMERLSKLNNQWVEDKEFRPLTMFQLAKVAFVADRELCNALGLVDVARRDWLSLSDKERQQWMGGIGPDKPKKRRELYAAVMAVLKDISR